MNLQRARCTSSDAMNDSDLTLLTRWRDGDRRAADELSRRYQGDLRQFFRTKAGPEDVEDLVQKVWLGLIETQGPQREAVVPTSFKAYLFGIARHVVIRHIEARYRLDNTVPIEQSIASLDPSLSQVVGERLKSQRLIRALQTLPVEMQILLELRYYTELSTAELAAIYDVPEGTIKSRVFNAKQRLAAATEPD